MSGENTPIKSLRYVSSDLRDGLTNLKAAIHNIIEALLKNEIDSYRVELPINGHFLSEIIQWCYPNCDFIRDTFNEVEMYFEDYGNIVIELSNNEAFFFSEPKGEQ